MLPYVAYMMHYTLLNMTLSLLTTMTPHLHTDKAGYDDGAQDTNAATSHTNGTNHQFMKLFKQRPIET